MPDCRRIVYGNNIHHTRFYKIWLKIMEEAARWSVYILAEKQMMPYSFDKGLQ